MHAEFQSRDAGLVIPVPPLSMAADCQAWLENLSGQNGTGGLLQTSGKKPGPCRCRFVWQGITGAW